jgi:hypothetical protein
MEGTVTSYNGATLVMNITKTGGSGTAHRWLVSTIPTTVLIDNVASGATMIAMTESTTQRTQFQNIKIAAGTGTGFVLTFNLVANGKAQLVHDCWVESTSTSGELLRSYGNRGLVHHCSFDSSPYSMAPLAISIKDPAGATGSWSTTSTMGTADLTGESNFYVEDSDFHAWLNAFDNDDNGRMVVRYSTFNHSGFGTHGADTSLFGQRHFEVYNNVFFRNTYSDGTTFNTPRWFYIRGGTYAIHDNSFSTAPGGNDYPTPSVDMTEMALQRNTGYNHACWGANIAGIQYSAPRQVGTGYVTGTARPDGDGIYFGDSEPAYYWNNTGALGNIGTSDYGGSDCTNPDSSASYIVSGRDYFNGTPKPGYTPYQYPHPLVGGTATTSSPVPPTPTNLVVK